MKPAINPELELMIERTVDVPCELLWRGWTDPEWIVQWFTPAPWKTVEAVIDLRVGGESYITMESPEGERHPNVGTYKEIIPNRKLVFGDDFFTGTILLEPTADGCRYIAIASHKTPEQKAEHEAMGFHAGWNAALDQLVELCKKNR